MLELFLKVVTFTDWDIPSQAPIGAVIAMFELGEVQHAKGVFAKYAFC